MADVRVMAVKTGMVFLTDIGIDVPCGVVVTIPAEKALISKDLYRYINQKVLFQIHPGSIHGPLPLPLPPLPKPEPLPPPPVSPPAGVMREVQQLREALEQREKTLGEALDRREHIFVAALMATQKKLDDVLLELQRRPAVSSLVPNTPMRPSIRVNEEGPSGEAPMFIPSEIGSKDYDSRVNITAESQESGVADAAAALRRLRQGAPQ